MSLSRSSSPPDLDDVPSFAVENRPDCVHKEENLEVNWDNRDSFSFDQIRSFAASCRICHLYVDIVLAIVTGSLPSVFKGTRNEAEKKLVLRRMNLFPIDAMVLPRTLRINILEKNIEIDICKDDADESRHFTIQGRRVPQTVRIGQRTNSEESFLKARQWLYECVTSHNCGEASLGSNRLPKRLLDVRGSAEDPIRLVETHGDEHPYACLSHRWGSPEQKRLISTTRTIQSHMTEIKWDDLPATFQDAVTICRRLAVSYCWIDSLCILQNEDDLTDDELEATRLDFAQQNSEMAQIYYNSHFTISADVSTHMNSGIFSKSSIDHHRIEIIDDAGDSAAIYIRQSINHTRTPDLETRGWTFQESALPRRLLHFGFFDIEWRCTNRHACECGDLKRNGGEPWHRHHFLAEVAKPVPRDLPGIVRWWEVVAHYYTARELTNPSDKLPALSGLAQLRKEARDGVYLAGLWQDSLIHDLCWYLCDNDKSTPSIDVVGRRPMEYRAPSWSWASMDSTDSRCNHWWNGNNWDEMSIVYSPFTPRTEPRQVCTIFDAFCQPKTADTTGEVKHGFLDIGVVLIPATVCLDPRQDAAWTITDIENGLELYVFRPDCQLEDDGLSIGAEVYCAPIAEAVDEMLQRGCLVLKKLSASSYQRVGFCVLWNWNEINDLSSCGDSRSITEAGGQLQGPSPPRLDRQDYTILDVDKSRIMII